MKKRCVLSHELPGENGKYQVFEAGRIYDVDPNAAHFEPLASPEDNQKLKTPETSTLKSRTGGR